MPLDPFFTSAHKTHFIPVEGVDELYAEIMTMSYDDKMDVIKKLYEKSKDKTLELKERIVLKKLNNEYRFLKYARAHNRMEKKRIKAAIEVKEGKRIPKPIIWGGYGMDSGTTSRQRRSRGQR